MNLRVLTLLALKIIGLTILFFIALMAGNMLFVAPAMPPVTVSPDRAAAQMTGWLIISLVNTLVVSLIILRSCWRGWRLALTVAFSLYGVMTFMAQIETASSNFIFGMLVTGVLLWVPARARRPLAPLARQHR